MLAIDGGKQDISHDGRGHWSRRVPTCSSWLWFPCILGRIDLIFSSHRRTTRTTAGRQFFLISLEVIIKIYQSQNFSQITSSFSAEVLKTNLFVKRLTRVKAFEEKRKFFR